MKKFLLLAMLVSVATIAFAQKRVSASSPDGQTTVTVTLGDRIYYDVASHGETLFQQCHIGLVFRDRTLGAQPVLKGRKVRRVSETVTPRHPLKFDKVENRYTLLTLTMDGGYQVEWRIYDDAVAYNINKTVNV